MNPNPPRIRVADALAAFDGKQSRLAAALSLSRASVNEWVKSQREFVPDLQAFRLAQLVPSLVCEGERGAA